MFSSFFAKISMFVLVIFGVHHVANPLLADKEKPVTEECMLGEIKLTALNFIPPNWTECKGQYISIAGRDFGKTPNSYLFSLLGTTYGGDGRTTFLLPDLRGRVPMGASLYGSSPAPGLSSCFLGQKKGRETNYLSVDNLPAHSHKTSVTINTANTNDAGQSNAEGKVFASAGRGGAKHPYYTDATNSSTLRDNATSVTVSNTGGGQAFDIVQPSLGLTYMICTNGYFPNRQ